ncbi:MAG TPA: LTA synthase family protein [Candidatus Deferrimicrobiaceae bacterium]|nr:LTA synthase family protein [Candidatus Deferrimicrobiaceae bacterium]
MRPPIPGPLRLAGVCLGLLALNVALLAVYRLLFVAWFAPRSAWGELPAVLLRGLRLDAAMLSLELLVVLGLLLLTRHARGGVLVALLWIATSFNAIVAGVNLLFVRERNQHLWEMLFAYLAEPGDIWVALRPFLLEHPALVALLGLVLAGFVVIATRHVRGLAPHRYDLWRPWYVAPVALGLLLLLALTMVQPITVKRVGGRPKTEVAWIASRHHMAFDDYALNQAVVNPLWDLVREYLPVALAGGRPPYRLEAAEALPLAQRLLGLPEGDRPYPLLRTVRGTGGLGIRNVVVIQVEGLGATLLERDEPQGPVMPFLRTLAAEGLYFPRVYQSFPSTDGAVFATLSSLHWTHAFGGRGERLSQSVMGTYFASLPRLLTTPGVRHYAFSGFRHRTAEIVSFQGNLGFHATGFDGLERQLAPSTMGPLGVNDGPLLQEAARAVIASPGPFSVYVMTGTSHSPWQVPPEAPNPLGNTPLGTFRYADDSIRAFVDRLRAERADFDQTLLVVTGDHTSATFNNQPLERLRLPLILAGPPIARVRGRWPAPADRPASEVDVLPTIASLLDGDHAYGGMGRSLFEPPVSAGIISGDTRKTLYLKDGFALRYRLKEGRAELLAVDGDAMPLADLSAEHPEVARRLTREFLALYETTDRLMRENRVFPIHAAARAP